MNSFTFIKRIKNIFSKATQKQHTPIQDHTVTNTEVKPSPISGKTIDTPKPVLATPDNSLVPVNPPTTVQILPKSIRPELPAVADNDLENSGLDSCARSEGDIEVLKAKLIIAMSNYLIEVALNEEDTKAEYAQQIEQTNYKIIHLNNIIANIQNELIPEQQQIIEEYKQKMQVIEQKTEQNHGVLPPSYPIMNLAVQDSKEAISRLKQKMQNNKSSIQKEEYHINSLNKRMKEMNLINPDVLSRRMNIFFNGWIMGLQGLGWSEAEIAIHKQVFLENEKQIRQQIEEKKTASVY